MSEIKEIKLDDLDESFFNDLKDGNFILVLGAGFSYGISNKAGNTIPIGDQFAQITKARFDDNSSFDYRSAAQVWRSQIRKEPKLIEEFKDHFLVDESKFDYKLYSSIFIPNWHNIFTLNFDNVLEIAQNESPYQNLRTYAYPDHTSGDYDPNIFHLHGIIDEETKLERLIFTPESYSEFGINLNTLYNVLHGDVRTLKKKILILGSQFKEDIILGKFFRELPEDDSVIIYHFDIENYNKNSDNFTLRDTTFIELRNKEGDIGTRAFLNLLQDNKHKIKNIQLPGTITIDKGFEEAINKGKSFSRSQFYSAKQDDNCQWYGILNDFDIERKDFQKIKKEVLQAFSSVTVSKVVAVIHGTGGCGKSTLLRRLAMQLNNEPDFELIWVKDNQIENFVQNALPKIQTDIEHKYLVFVEDWYRLIGQDIKLGKEFLKTTQSISNIRLVIGDRDIRGKDYVLNLINSENIFELSELENQDILEKIISKHTDWQNAFDLLTKQNTNIYNSPLFLILFAIAGVSEERFEITESEFSDLENTVRRIAKYDLRKIAEHKNGDKYYPGFAKALHYWACVYSKYKIFISYSTFLEIADFYNRDKEISSNFKNWELDNKVLDKLKLYINVSPNENLSERFQAIDFIQFNHDKLAENVLSAVEFESWEAYDDIQKRNLLKTILHKGDDFAASMFLLTMVLNEDQIFEDKKEIIYYINLLINNDSRLTGYLTLLYSPILTLGHSVLKKYLDQLAKKRIYPVTVWENYFARFYNSETEKSAFEILSNNNIENIHPSIIAAALSNSKNDNLKQKTSDEILSHKNIIDFKHAVVSAFKFSKNRKIKKTAVFKILTHKDLLTLQHHIVTAAFRQSGNDEEKNAAAFKILTHKNLLSLQHDVVIAAFHQSGNDAEKETAAFEILTHKDLLTLQHHLVTAAFRQPRNEDQKEAAALKILTHEDLSTLQTEIVSAAFRQSGNDDEKETAAFNILTHKDFLTLQHEIITVAFRQSGNDDEKQAAANKILMYEDLLSLQEGVLKAAFQQPGNDDEKQAAAYKILTHKDFLSLHHVIITEVFLQVGNDDEKQAAAYKILTAPDFITLQYDIVKSAFRQPENDEQKKEAAIKILTDEDLLTLQSEIVSMAFRQPGNDDQKKVAAKKILQNPDWNADKNLFPVFDALLFYSEERDSFSFVREIVKSIIDTYLSNTKLKKSRDFYFGLMYIPFHQYGLWKRKSEYILTNWNKIERRGITNVLHSYTSYPQSIRGVCENILKNWRIEIFQNINKVYGKPDKGNHIRIALGHPELQTLAHSTAEEIFKAKEDNSVDVPEYLFEIVEKIVNENIFPDWNPKDEDDD